MDERLIKLVDAVENEGLDYALVCWSYWKDLEEDFPELYKHIKTFQDEHEWLEKYVSELEMELDNE